MIVAAFISTALSATHTLWSANTSIDSRAFDEEMSELEAALDSRTYTVDRSASATTLNTWYDYGTVILLR